MTSAVASTGPWLDLGEAAVYAGVPQAEIAGAVARRELGPVSSDPIRLGAWLVAAHDVEVWAELRAELTACA